MLLNLFELYMYDWQFNRGIYFSTDEVTRPKKWSCFGLRKVYTEILALNWWSSPRTGHIWTKHLMKLLNFTRTWRWCQQMIATCFSSRKCLAITVLMSGLCLKYLLELGSQNLKKYTLRIQSGRVSKCYEQKLICNQYMYSLMHLFITTDLSNTLYTIVDKLDDLIHYAGHNSADMFYR